MIVLLGGRRHPQSHHLSDHLLGLRVSAGHGVGQRGDEAVRSQTCSAHGGPGRAHPRACACQRVSVRAVGQHAERGECGQLRSHRVRVLGAELCMHRSRTPRATERHRQPQLAREHARADGCGHSVRGLGFYRPLERTLDRDTPGLVLQAHHRGLHQLGRYRRAGGF